MIKLLTSMAGEGFAYGYGETVELDAEYEKRLVESGQAELISKPKPAKVTKNTK